MCPVQGFTPVHRDDCLLSLWWHQSITTCGSFSYRTTLLCEMARLLVGSLLRASWGAEMLKDSMIVDIFWEGLLGSRRTPLSRGCHFDSTGSCRRSGSWKVRDGEWKEAMSAPFHIPRAPMFSQCTHLFCHRQTCLIQLPSPFHWLGNAAGCFYPWALPAFTLN